MDSANAPTPEAQAFSPKGMQARRVSDTEPTAAGTLSPPKSAAALEGLPSQALPSQPLYALLPDTSNEQIPSPAPLAGLEVETDTGPYGAPFDRGRLQEQNAAYNPDRPEHHNALADLGRMVAACPSATRADEVASQPLCSSGPSVVEAMLPEVLEATAGEVVEVASRELPQTRVDWQQVPQLSLDMSSSPASGGDPPRGPSHCSQNMGPSVHPIHNQIANDDDPGNETDMPGAMQGGGTDCYQNVLSEGAPAMSPRSAACQRPGRRSQMLASSGGRLSERRSQDIWLRAPDREIPYRPLAQPPSEVTAKTRSAGHV